MNYDRIASIYRRPNSELIFAAPAQTTGGLKGIVAGKYTCKMIFWF